MFKLSALAQITYVLTGQLIVITGHNGLLVHREHSLMKYSKFENQTHIVVSIKAPKLFSYIYI